MTKIPSSSSIKSCYNLMPRYQTKPSRGHSIKFKGNTNHLLSSTLKSFGIGGEVEQIRIKAENSRSKSRKSMRKMKQSSNNLNNLNIQITDSPIPENIISRRSQSSKLIQAQSSKKIRAQLKKPEIKSTKFKQIESPNRQTQNDYKQILEKMQKDDKYILSKEYLLNNNYLKSPSQSCLPPVMYFKPIQKNQNKNKFQKTAPFPKFQKLQVLQKGNKFQKFQKEQRLANYKTQNPLLLKVKTRKDQWNYQKNMDQLILMKKNRIKDMYKNFNVRGCRILRSKTYQKRKLQQIVKKQQPQKPQMLILQTPVRYPPHIQKIDSPFQYASQQTDRKMQIKSAFEKTFTDSMTKQLIASEKSRKTVISKEHPRWLKVRSDSLESEFYKQNQMTNIESSELSQELKAKIQASNYYERTSVTPSPRFDGDR